MNTDLKKAIIGLIHNLSVKSYNRTRVNDAIDKIVENAGGGDKKEDNVWFKTGIALPISKRLENLEVGDYFSFTYSIYKTEIDNNLIKFSLLSRWDDYGDSIYPPSDFTISDLKTLLRYNSIRIIQNDNTTTTIINVNAVEFNRDDSNSFTFYYTGGSFTCTYEPSNKFIVTSVTRN